jgi:lactoylglutathione lyase
MDRAVKFHREQLGLALRFQSPGWSEFETGTTTLALHPGSAAHPPGTCQLGFGVPNLDHFYNERRKSGVEFTSPPAAVHGRKIARFKDADGAECSVGGP